MVRIYSQNRAPKLPPVTQTVTDPTTITADEYFRRHWGVLNMLAEDLGVHASRKCTDAEKEKMREKVRKKYGCVTAEVWNQIWRALERSPICYMRGRTLQADCLIDQRALGKAADDLRQLGFVRIRVHELHPHARKIMREQTKGRKIPFPSSGNCVVWVTWETFVLGFILDGAVLPKSWLAETDRESDGTPVLGKNGRPDPRKKDCVYLGVKRIKMFPAHHDPGDLEEQM